MTKSDSKIIARKTSRLFERFDRFYTPNWKKIYTDEDLITLSEGYAKVMQEVDGRKIAKALDYISSGKSEFNQRPPRPLELRELAANQILDENQKNEQSIKTKAEAVWEPFFSKALSSYYQPDKNCAMKEISAFRVDLPTITAREFEILSGSPFSADEIFTICKKYKIYLSTVQKFFLENTYKGVK